MKTHGLFLFALSLLAHAGAAHAQSTPDEEARSHFRSGEAYFQRADYERALQAFETSYELSEREQLQYNIALCHERLAQLEEAIEAFEAYLAWQAESGDDSISRTSLEARVATLRQRIARESEGEEAATAPPLDPPVREVPPPEAPSRPSRFLVPSIVAFGVGAAGAVTFALMGGLTLRENSNLSECKADRSCSDADLSNLRTFRRGADVGLALGLAGTAVGATLLVLHLREDERSSLRLTPVVSPQFAGASGEVRF